MDYGITPNVLSPRLIKQFGIATETIIKIVTVANGNMTGAVEEVSNVPASIDDLDVKVGLFTLPKLPFNILIRRCTRKIFRCGLHFDAEEDCFDYKGQRQCCQ